MQGKYRFRSVLYPRKIGRFRAASLLLAALAVGLVLSACGGGGNGELLPGATADRLSSNVDQVQESFENGNCEKAQIMVAQVTTEVDDLHQVDVRLKKALKDGAAKLSEAVSSCAVAEEEAAEAEAEEAAEAELEEQEQIETEEAEAEEEAFLEEQKEEERAEKAQEKAEKEAEQPEPPTGGEESTPPNGKAKGHEEETIPPTPEESEVTPPGGSGPGGGIGPGAEVEGGE